MAESRVSEKRRKPARKAAKLVTQIVGAKTVSVTGDFSSWSEEGIPMRHGSDDHWEADLMLAPGQYQYRLRVDGRWQDHAEAKERVPSPFGCENCVLTVL